MALGWLGVVARCWVLRDQAHVWGLVLRAALVAARPLPLLVVVVWWRVGWFPLVF